MDKKTIKKLNQLNKDFYKQTAKYFSQARQGPWQGWHKLLPLIEKIDQEKREFKVLDLGCGNGRFGLFLKSHLEVESFSYLGVDNNRQLLNIAQRDLSQTKINYKLEKLDLIDQLLADQLEFKQNFDLIVGFGLVHHIPGFKLRQKLFNLIEQNLTGQGIGILTLWQFARKPRFLKKTIKPEKAGLTKKELDENDFILDWQRGVKAYRYCHFVDLKEQNQLVANSKLILMDEYLADGKSNKLNKYLVLKRR